MKEKKRILVVEDEPDILDFIRVILEHAGYMVLKATNGREALKQMQHNPDLVLLDVKMVDTSGLEIMKQFKEDRQYKHIPIIILSALAREEDIQEGLQTGAEEYLTKPFSREQLLRAIQRYV